MPVDGYVPSKPGQRRIPVADGAVVGHGAPPGQPGMLMSAASMVRTPEGWARVAWWVIPARRGWVPRGLDDSPIIEFTAHNLRAGRWRRVTVRWYWLAVDVTADALTVIGPFATADDADGWPPNGDDTPH